MKYIKSISDQCQMFWFRNFFLKLHRSIYVQESMQSVRVSHICYNILHVVPQEATTECGQPKPKLFKRSSNCFLLVVKTYNLRESCNSLLKRVGKKQKQISFTLKTPAKRIAPPSKTSHKRVTLALKQKRLRCSELEAKIKKMKQDIENKYVPLDKEISEDISKIMTENLDQATPFMKLFWNEQQKFFNSKKKPLCYHPMIIGFSLSIAVKSASAYGELRNSKCLTLPSRKNTKGLQKYNQIKSF